MVHVHQFSGTKTEQIGFICHWQETVFLGFPPCSGALFLFTREGSLVQSQYRPPYFSRTYEEFREIPSGAREPNLMYQTGISKRFL